jgi:hypothetical protein
MTLPTGDEVELAKEFFEEVELAWSRLNHAHATDHLGTSDSACLLCQAEHQGQEALVDEIPSLTLAQKRTVTAAARLLPVALRERQLREWLDHLECERETARDLQRALWSILLRSVIPIAVTARARSIGHVFARPR